MNITREFLKHGTLGEIYAVEYVGDGINRELVAAWLCTKVEEMTLGALPVLQMHAATSALGQATFVRENLHEFVKWEPPQTPDDLIRRVIEQQRTFDQLLTAYTFAKNTEKLAARELEKAREALLQLTRDLAETRPRPLLALIDGDAGTNTPSASWDS
jgi:hypothetical protein